MAASGSESTSLEAVRRMHRDVHAATQHIILSDMWLLDAGRVALGAEPLVPLFGW